MLKCLHLKTELVLGEGGAERDQTGTKDFGSLHLGYLLASLHTTGIRGVGQEGPIEISITHTAKLQLFTVKGSKKAQKIVYLHSKTIQYHLIKNKCTTYVEQI